MVAPLAAAVPFYSPSASFPGGAVQKEYQQAWRRKGKPLQYATIREYGSCLEARFDPNAAAWECTDVAPATCRREAFRNPPPKKYGGKSPVWSFYDRGCSPTPPERLWTYAEIRPGAPERVPATPEGVPIYPATVPADPAAGESGGSPEVPDASGTDWGKIAKYAAAGIAVALVLRRFSR